GFWGLGGQRGEQGRETGVVLVIWVRSQFQECSHECDGTVIDRVFQNDLSDATWTATVREIRRISEQGFQLFQIALLIRFMNGNRVAHSADQFCLKIWGSALSQGPGRRVGFRWAWELPMRRC